MGNRTYFSWQLEGSLKEMQWGRFVRAVYLEEKKKLSQATKKIEDGGFSNATKREGICMFVAAGGVQSKRYSILTNLGIFSPLAFFLVFPSHTAND